MPKIDLPEKPRLLREIMFIRTTKKNYHKRKLSLILKNYKLIENYECGCWAGSNLSFFKVAILQCPRHSKRASAMRLNKLQKRLMNEDVPKKR